MESWTTGVEKRRQTHITYRVNKISKKEERQVLRRPRIDKGHRNLSRCLWVVRNVAFALLVRHEAALRTHKPLRIFKVLDSQTLNIVDTCWDIIFHCKIERLFVVDSCSGKSQSMCLRIMYQVDLHKLENPLAYQHFNHSVSRLIQWPPSAAK